MQQQQLVTEYIRYENKDELDTESKKLIELAIATRRNAYAPYSNFSVGAAILLENNKIVTGSNQENAAYPSGMCAERVAIYSAGSMYPKVSIKKIAISASSSTKTVIKPVAPCGSCRQAIAEYEVAQKTPIEIFFMGETGNVIKVNSLSALLPLSFDKSFL